LGIQSGKSSCSDRGHRRKRLTWTHAAGRGWYAPDQFERHDTKNSCSTRRHPVFVPAKPPTTTFVADRPRVGCTSGVRRRPRGLAQASAGCFWRHIAARPTVPCHQRGLTAGRRQGGTTHRKLERPRFGDSRPRPHLPERAPGRMFLNISA